MNLNDLAQAITASTDGVRIEGPRHGTWSTTEIIVASRLGDGREVTVTGDGNARWMANPAGGPQRASRRRLPADVEAAAETVIGLVYGE